MEKKATEAAQAAEKTEDVRPSEPDSVIADQVPEPELAAGEKASEPASPPPTVPAPEQAVPAQTSADSAALPATPVTASNSVQSAPAQPQAAPPGAEAPAPAPSGPAPAEVQETAPTAPSADRRRSQPMTEYEAYRKAAQEERRKMYERMRQPMQAPWRGGQKYRPYYRNPYYGNPYQPRGSN